MVNNNIDATDVSTIVYIGVFH